MKKLFILCAAMTLFVAGQNVRAGMATLDDAKYFSTDDTTGWSVARVLTYNENGYGNAHERYWNQAMSNFNELTLDSYGEVKETSHQAPLGSQGGVTDEVSWITTESAGVDREGKGGVDNNGYYAYKYEFTWDAVTDIDQWDSVFANFAFTAGADDHLHAVYLNGLLLWAVDDHSAMASKENWQDNTLVIQASTEIDSDLLDTANSLVFIVHNDGHYGQASGNYSNGENATGFAAFGSFNLTAQRVFDDDGELIGDAGTPEPATLLILGLGTLGAGLYGRRRIQK